MAPPDNLPPEPTEDFAPPPDHDATITNPKRVTLRKKLEANDPETIKIRSRPHHHPFSRRQRHARRILRKPYVKKETQQLDNTKNESTNHGNEPLTRDECVLLFTTLTAPIVETMKLQTEALHAFHQTMQQESQAALTQQKQENQAALIQQKQENQAALIQQKQRDQSIEHMLQIFLTQNQPDDSAEIRQPQSLRISRIISDTSEKNSTRCIDLTTDPTTNPTADPTADPTTDPTTDPIIDPTTDPTTEPTNQTTNPATESTANPRTSQIIREFDLQFKLVDTITHLRQTHERLLSYFQHRHKKKQWTMPTLANPQSPTKNSEKPEPSLHAT